MKTYRTIQGDQWDMIAYKLYKGLGGENQMSTLIDANPEYVDMTIFPANIILNVPEVNTPVSSNLPPWKRGQINV